LPRLVGKGIASELIFTGRRVKAEEAYCIGLVNAVYEQEQLPERAMTMATSIAENSPGAVRSSKMLIAASHTEPVEEGLILEAEAFADAFEGADQREGMGAFVEKRKAAFADLRGS
jgi:enoyl-CoA hydratase